MVQGNFLAIGIGHLIVASQTGVIAGILAGSAILFTKTNKRWVISLILGVLTGVVDYLVHPGMFGSVATEAMVTGAAAAILSYLIDFSLSRFRQAPTVKLN